MQPIDPTRQSRGRHGRPWRTVKAKVYAEETNCWLCGRWVDQTLHRQPHHRQHPHSRSVDHLVQLQHDGNPLDRTNLHLAHLTCNVTRSNRLRRLPKYHCACSLGLPCARISNTNTNRRHQPTRQQQPNLSVDLRTI